MVPPASVTSCSPRNFISIYSELTTHVRIADESGGEYVEVQQSGRNDLGKIAIEPDEWPTLRAAIDELVAVCRDV